MKSSAPKCPSCSAPYDPTKALVTRSRPAPTPSRVAKPKAAITQNDDTAEIDESIEPIDAAVEDDDDSAPLVIADDELGDVLDVGHI